MSVDYSSPIAVSPSPRKLAADCDAYLSERTATFEQRCSRYAATYHVMEMHGELANSDILLDLGAGGTDLDAYLRLTHSWRGRYWPVDGWMGYDLRWWSPVREVEWTVCLEVIEHISMPIALQMLHDFKRWSTKGVVLSTPNPDTVDVLGIDATHVWACHQQDLQRAGYQTLITSLYGKEDDSILAWWCP